MPDPETPEWPVAWAAKEVLRQHLGPKFDRRLPLFLAKAILERMRLIGFPHLEDAETPISLEIGRDVYAARQE